MCSFLALEKVVRDAANWLLTRIYHSDIVDTVEFENGNIWKMLFGAVNRGLDDDEDDAEAIDPSAPALPFPS